MTSRLTRRQALRQLATGTAAAVSAPLWVDNLLALADQHAAHRPSPEANGVWAPKVFNPRQNELVITVTELIIPETDTPGAKAAKVNEYIDMVLAVATPEDRDKFLQGLAWIDTRSTETYHSPFVNAPPPQQIDLLTTLSTATTPSPADGPGVEFFQALKGMTITGFYTSEPGLLQDIGDDGQMFFAEFKGCEHKEHGA
jgi:hypothetical protein